MTKIPNPPSPRLQRGNVTENLMSFLMSIYRLRNLLVVLTAYNVFTYEDGQKANQQTTILIIGDAATVVTLTNQIRKGIHGHLVIIIQKHLHE